MIKSLWLNVLDGVLRITGMRDRLRCPKCGAVGTWKMHGTYLDREDTRKEIRQMCKWCGHYVGPEGVKKAAPCSKGYWALTGRCNKTPMEKCIGVWPWRG